MESGSDKPLTHAIQNMLEFQTNISISEKKIQTLMRECKEGLIKRAGDSVNNSSMRWMKASHTSNEESSSGPVITMKARVVEVGIQLSNLVIDFVFMMSRQDEFAEKIGKFKAVFKWATKINSRVIDKVFHLLEMADSEVRKMRRSQDLKNKGKPVIDDSNRDERSNERTGVKELVHQFLEQILYQIFDQFLQAVLSLEFITSYWKLPDSELELKKPLSVIECDVKHCETVVEWLRQDIIALQTMFPYKLEFEEAKMAEARNLVAPKIYEIWIGLLDSSEPDVHWTRYVRKNGNTASETEPGDVQTRSAGVTRAEVEQVQSSLNDEGEDLPESASETEVEAEKPSKKCCCCCCK